MPDIKIRSRGTNLGWRFTVEVSEESGSTRHRVTMDRDFVTRIGAGHNPERVIEKSFEFLLSHEPKEAILTEFDVSIISKYFPDFIANLGRLLENDPSPQV